jgi:uncharacterized protein Smg (DUF494 family)
MFWEEIVEDRMMNLFSLIADQVRHKQELFDNEGKIMQALLNNGFRLQEADAALTLMQTLTQKEPGEFIAAAPNAAPASLRAMNREERERFTVDAFGFITKLTHLGIISDDLREELLEKALIMYSERIELDHVKSLVAFTLFAGHYEGEHHASLNLRRIKKTAWN